MGISPIEYRAWSGERKDHYKRFLVVSQQVFLRKLKSVPIAALLIVSMMIIHVFPLLILTLTPHEELKATDMVGEYYVYEVVDFYDTIPPKGMSPYLDPEGDVVYHGQFWADGSLTVNGSIGIIGEFDLDGKITGMGTLNSHGPNNFSGELATEDGTFVIDGTLKLNGTIWLMNNRVPRSNVTLSGDFHVITPDTGYCEIDGEGTVTEIPVTKEDFPEPYEQRQGGYLRNELFVIIAMLLVSLVCSDLVSEDILNNSFVLYFSRPIRTLDYIGGKMLGALSVAALLCFVPPILVCLSVIGTQTGSDYAGSFKVMGVTLMAGLFTAYIFIPYALLISSLTKRKAYAAIGTFMSFFVLLILGNTFSGIDRNWMLISPPNILFYTYELMFGFGVHESIDTNLLGAVIAVLAIAPLLLLYLRIHLKGVGR